MDDLLTHLVDAPLANILILAGLAFLGVAVIGKISGKIEPSNTGRVMAGVLGLALVVYGIHSHAVADAAQSSAKQNAGGEVHPRQTHPEPQPKTSLVGIWTNSNPQTRGVTRLEIEQSGDSVLVHAWGACSPRDCDWGSQPAALNAGSANVAWEQGFVTRKMALALDGSRLRMSLDSVYRDNRAPQQGLEYFVRQ